MTTHVLSLLWVMSKNKNLTPADRARIRAMHAERGPDGRRRYTQKEIARAQQVNQATVSRVVKAQDQCGPVLKRGPKFLMDERTRRRVVRYFFDNCGVSTGDAVTELDLKVSPETVRRFIRNEGAQYVKLKTTPPLTDRHKAARMSFARHHLQGYTNFRKWIWSDEKRFCLDGPDGLYHTWSLPSSAEQLKSKRAFNGGGIMVWGAIRDDHTVALAEVTVRMNSEVYQEVLSRHLLPYWEEFREIMLPVMGAGAPSTGSVKEMWSHLVGQP
ncbi:transposable element tc3 transposase, putative [Perkinsus marinus ATCC 50983]|uniref:Transposable element tc3 transposase, putative n=1 Tax=Perkinsus marinus (strain ATCC 50983 / TXsc) TaxID=423536 RepID=C5LP84_PERM5|nr:transposable element tc3 transposase, putative [Perkinsus marinus ATCC 50983]EER01461.1 transposable element tc3 transposase, putative [Perkinsus marinus ATCC 50983]|eukprot:XP_002768743.1 transposable element tc3 transposase, putative [Perkinsus marinus ATCC 50983]